MNSMLNDFDFIHCFEIDEGMFRNKHNEIRGMVEKGIADFRISGQGDGTNSNNDGDYFDSCDNTPTKGVSIKCSLKVHLSEILIFCNLDPIACYARTCMVNHGLL